MAQSIINLRRKALRGGAARAFSLIELMVAIAILGVIIYALYHMFNQTQKAMRGNEIQSDVSEKARAILEMVSREISQAQPTYITTFTNGIGYKEINFFGSLEINPVVQKAPGRGDVTPRTNMLYQIYFLLNRTNAWQGIGYRVVDVKNGVGTLVRYETNRFGFKPQNNDLLTAFLKEGLTNTTRGITTNLHAIADGVIHFKVIPYDKNGYQLSYSSTNRVPGYYTITRRLPGPLVITDTNFSDVVDTNYANVVLDATPWGLLEETDYAFKSNALPAYVDLELAMLEPDALKQFNLMLQDQNPGATNYLSRQINKVHLYRERIPIRTAAQ